MVLERSTDTWLQPAVAAGAAAGVAVANSQYQEPDRPMSSAPASGYIPYSDIYAPQPQQARQGTFHETQSNFSLPIRQQQPQQYQQSLYDQQGGQSQAKYAERGRGRYERRGSDSSDLHDSEDDGRRHHRKKRSSRSKQRDSSRARLKSSGEARPRAKSSIRDRFDTSERGLGYGSVGALAGGLLGNELGKGVLPTLAGAVIGGLGANAFENKDK